MYGEGEALESEAITCMQGKWVLNIVCLAVITFR